MLTAENSPIPGAFYAMRPRPIPEMRACFCAAPADTAKIRLVWHKIFSKSGNLG
jgi:hypothetical protein